MAHKVRSRVVATAIALALMTAGATANADPTPADKETARRLMDQGRERLAQKDSKGALEAFKAADEIMRVPTTGLMVANEQVNLGLLLEARETLARVLRTPRAATEPEAFQRARATAQELNDTLGDRIPAVRIDVGAASTDPSLAIAVDDAPISSAVVKFPYRVNPGRHVITAKTGTSSARQDIDVKERETKDVVLQLQSATTSPAAAAATREQPATSSGPKTLTYVAFGVAGAGLVVGTITGLLTLSSKGAAEEGCVAGECPPPTHDDLSTAHTMATISTVSFIVAGVGATVGVISLLTGRSSPPAATAAARAARVEPWAGLGSAGLRGSF